MLVLYNNRLITKLFWKLFQRMRKISYSQFNECSVCWPEERKIPAKIPRYRLILDKLHAASPLHAKMKIRHISHDKRSFVPYRRYLHKQEHAEARPMTRNVRHFLTRQSMDENNILQSLCICITRDECRQVWLADWVYRGRAPRNRYAFVSAENPEIDGLSRAADAAAGMVWRVVARVNQPLS